MRLVWVNILFCISTSVFPQSDSLNYPFLKRDSNVFIFWGNQGNYDSLFIKFNNLQITGEQQIRILHIGDSHVQADIFTNQIRRNFAETFFHLLGPPAIAFPYGILRNNSPVTTKLSCNGNWSAFTLVSKSKESSVLGFTAITSDTCHSKIIFSINKKAIQNTSFNQIFLLTNNDSSHVHLKPFIDVNGNYKLLNDSVALRIFTFNQYLDTITFKLRIKSDSAKFILYGLIPMNDDPGIVYHTLGLNGAKAATYLNTLLPEYVALMHYDWVIISLGTNDCYMPHMDSLGIAQPYEALIKNIRRLNPNVPILLTTPMEHYRKHRYINTNVYKTRDIIINIAQKEHCAVWDLFNVAGGIGSMYKWYKNHLTVGDKLHLNAIGYHLVGNLFFEAFMNTYLNGFLVQ